MPNPLEGRSPLYKGIVDKHVTLYVNDVTDEEVREEKNPVLRQTNVHLGKQPRPHAATQSHTKKGVREN
ncbi:hypothetical protein KIN20_024346 [Parelaphostrongylus tenuis]|uniref:Uncharacterized protein n=1 Tax=Parelaphostrongylus tenuis TaxID=148309 RepID=A0AAD5QTL9_PARTN|nr:hypothetical protein KIN20_024346 [Parelaphostrongylus tenuis]